MKRVSLILALALAWPVPAAFGLDNPGRSAADYRIKHTNYNPDDVVRLDAVIGIATHIILQPGENYVTHAFGDPNGWEFAHKDNHYFIKPKAENSDTNLVIVTDKRSYNFVLHFIGSYTTKDAAGNTVKHPITTPWALKNATLQLAFNYPADDARKAAEAKTAASVQDRFRGRTGSLNLNYTQSSTHIDQDIVPLNVWDDGRFTYFRFAENVSLPNVYTVGSDGEETLVNRHMSPEDNRVIVAEKIAPKFRLRLGDQVVGIYDEAYSQAGPGNSTGTASPSVHRVVKGSAQ
ncbi:Type IV secretion system protein virB9 [Paraburkholderia ultramafica]|uniref:Type IV secretion system protein virB9 n=1 Tax=Paraburkholderia ultramafica TaxID=1544867 RepID=A0A6S7D0G5_9BURK|nr:P-type conjugative transfer protein VirB9 [Paraburkholderia ultramafica]CAB3802680.1 Type IV secretion system protein virB9 [Paraburkholderia ultramafica]